MVLFGIDIFLQVIVIFHWETCNLNFLVEQESSEVF